MPDITEFSIEMFTTVLAKRGKYDVEVRSIFSFVCIFEITITIFKFQW